MDWVLANSLFDQMYFHVLARMLTRKATFARVQQPFAHSPCIRLSETFEDEFSWRLARSNGEQKKILCTDINGPIDSKELPKQNRIFDHVLLVSLMVSRPPQCTALRYYYACLLLILSLQTSHRFVSLAICGTAERGRCGRNQLSSGRVSLFKIV